MFNNVKTIIFDYDGTIHDSLVIYQKAFIEAYQFLFNRGKVPKRVWLKDEIKLFLGKNPKEMWADFEPKLDQDTISQASQIISKSMSDQIQNNQAVLYEGAIETLKYLRSKKYTLVYLSNSKRYYMDVNREKFKLDLYFDLMICSEDYHYITKTDILKRIKPSLKGDHVIIGDRFHDMDAGRDNQILTIACDYGYGLQSELKDAMLHIQDIRQLKDIL
jgi:phosphoglycolate phosphatase